MSRLVRALSLLVVVSVVAGLVVAAIALPLVGGVGLAAKAGADSWERLPVELSQPPLPQRTRILAADGSVIADFYYQNRVAAALKDIPLVTQRALIAVEDARFYEHNGLDIRGTIRAFVTDQQGGGARQGGSTLTQQYVKNILLLNAKTPAEQKAATEDSLDRKLREARYALALEQNMSKDQILEGYLNIAYFGEGAYGIGSAALHYFSTPVSRLDLAQSALLVGFVKNPYGYDPVHFPKRAVERRAVVLVQMEKAGYITHRQRLTAQRTPLRLKLRTETNGCGPSRAPYYCQWVYDQIKNNPAFGATPAARTNLLLRGGLTIRTTLDWKVQRAADKAVQSLVPPDKAGNPRGIATAEAVVEPGTGAVKALAVNLPYGNDAKKGQNAVNLALGGSSGFQAGSTYKMFTLVTALEQGIPPSFRMFAPRQLVAPDLSYPASSPLRNAGDSEGDQQFTLLQGTAASVNTFFVELEQRVGVMAAADTATKMGIQLTKFKPRQPNATDGSFTLGAWESDPLEMAEAYATLAARGKYCQPFGLVSATTPDGKILPLSSPTCSQVIEQGVADTATNVLTHVIDGPEFHTGGNAVLAGGRPAAGKTGTTNSSAAAWFDGYTPQLAAAVWVGDPKGLVPGLNDVTIAGRTYPHMYGGDLPAQVWKATMDAALDGVAVQAFPQSDPFVERGQQVPVPDLAGLSPQQALSRLSDAGLVGALAPVAVDSLLPKGTVDSSEPASGTPVPLGTTVVVVVSNGTPPPPVAPPTTAPPTSAPPSKAPPTTGPPTKAPPTKGPPSKGPPIKPPPTSPPGPGGKP